MTTTGAVAEDTDLGFSLVEVLVVLALVAVLSATMMGAISQFGSLMRSDRRLDSFLALQKTVGHMANLIEATQDIAAAAPEGGRAPRSALIGKPGEISFLAIARRGAYISGLRDVTIRAEGKAGDKRLVQEMAPRRLDNVSAEDIEMVELAQHVTAYKFVYYGAQGEDTEASWQENWSDTTRLPVAISIHLSVRRNDTVVTASDIATLGLR